MTAKKQANAEAVGPLFRRKCWQCKQMRPHDLMFELTNTCVPCSMGYSAKTRGQKLRTCLNCERPFMSRQDMRICAACKNDEHWKDNSPDY